MRNVLIAGAGKIGSFIGFLLSRTPDYRVFLIDKMHSPPALKKLEQCANCHYLQLDVEDEAAVSQFLKQQEIAAVVSSLPYYCNLRLAKLAAAEQAHYFDLTEDTQTTAAILELSKHYSSTFVTQCGLAPGWVNIVAEELMRHFSQLETVKLRVGALPMHASNGLHYALTWSTEGLINEYGNPCQMIENGKLVLSQPLEGLEEINIDGQAYEAFNTSGGIGSLTETYKGKVKELNYKTIRYPGHCEKIKFLMNDLKLNQDRKTLKHIFENALPMTVQDVVVVSVSVIGKQETQHQEENYVRKFYPQTIDGELWSAIQLTTGSCLCAVMDLVFQYPQQYHGFLHQEQFSMEAIVTNRFGAYYLS
jgi:saccharopine dehydrogenase-like NADP-dependent oxidoreductase